MKLDTRECVLLRSNNGIKSKKLLKYQEFSAGFDFRNPKMFLCNENKTNKALNNQQLVFYILQLISPIFHHTDNYRC